MNIAHKMDTTVADKRILGDVQYEHNYNVYILKTGTLKLNKDALTHHNDTTRNRWCKETQGSTKWANKNQERGKQIWGRRTASFCTDYSKLK